jgi:hypothetical protein
MEVAEWEGTLMASVRWYRVPVYLNNEQHRAYFYETDSGGFDLQSGFVKYTTRLHGSLDDAIKEFRLNLQKEHVVNGVEINTGEPIEVSYDEVRQNAPSTDE